MADRVVTAAVGLAILTWLTSTCRAEQAPAFPTAPEDWVNSTPLSKELVRGKAVFLWFFEET